MSDKLKVHDSLASLEVGAAPEPYRLNVGSGKYIVFPDPGQMTWDIAEDFITDLSSANSLEDVFGRWLSAEDWDKLKAAKPTLMQMKALSANLQRHYSYIFGDLGEGSASGIS